MWRVTACSCNEWLPGLGRRQQRKEQVVAVVNVYLMKHCVNWWEYIAEYIGGYWWINWWVVEIYFLYCKELGEVLGVCGGKVESKAKGEEEDDEAEEKKLGARK